MSLLNNVTIVLFICHVLGDFQFQTQEMSDMKTRSLVVLAKHLVIHALVLALLPILLFGWSALSELWMLILFVWLSHCLLDSIKFYFNRFKHLTEETLYIADQLFHILVLLFLSEYVFTSNLTLNILSLDILKWVLLLLVISKPANITFKIVFQKYQFKTDSETIPGAGAMIGNLERILSAIFLAMNQIAAIGFIYTAKSIARFKEIDDNKGFAEYYLIGTLFSILYVVVAYFVIIVL